MMTTTAHRHLPLITADNPDWIRLEGCRHRPPGPPGTRTAPSPDTDSHAEAAALACPHHHSTPSRPSPRHFPHDARYLELLVADFGRWVQGGFGVPDFLDSLQAFQPQEQRR